jgi:TP901 family phage tail tape measure protein
MAEENLVTNIVAKSNFSDLIADLNRVSAKLLSLQQTLNTTNKTLAVQAAQMQKSFSQTMRSTGQFSTHFVSLQSDVDKFGRSLDSGRMKLGQYYGAWRDHSRTAGGLIRDLARQQVQLQNSVLQPMGKNAQGIMQYAVHVPRGLDEIKNKTAIARQEMMIMNKVIQDGANQVINWGKNTQWAGRQLTVGLTLPIAMFGKAAADAFREADEQLVRLTKVYGGVAATSAVELAKVRKEVSETARELSAAYGASFKDTIGLAADIAATGKQGEELLQSTREATRLSILGEVDRQDAMKATLSIQTAFKQNTEELAASINFLNAVENQTSTSLADLVEAIPKAGPVVKALGGDVEDLALYLTAMREGGINASEGANALKSALASIINPTKVAKAQFLGFGIDLEGIVNKNAGNLTQTILSIQSALDALDPLNKAQAIEQLFGKFQFARMNALFENLGKQGSQTLQVLDLMKASSDDLANIAGRELAAITESASGKYRRALETLKADLAGIGEQFLNFGTKIINIIDGVVRFFNKLPDPVKKILTFVTGLTALTGPIIMLTGLMANFFGYIAKGLFHLRALVTGGKNFKLLTPEIIAAEQAGQLMETQFYDDAKAASVLQRAISNLTAELSLLQTKANSARVAVGPAISTAAGSVIMEGQARVADPAHPLIGRPYSRSFAHLNPVAGMTEEQRLAQTIFGVAPNPGPLNQKISNNPQMYMDSDLPRIDRVSSAKGFSTGIIAGEAAKWHAMTAALAMQSKEEISLLKSEVAATGTVTSSLSTSYRALLPEMTKITSLAAQEGALIVRQLEAGKLTVDQARSKIIALNAQIEAMIAQTATGIASAQGRTLSLTTVPLTSQPVVDPTTGKSNMKELFHKGKTASMVDQIARALGVKTSGGGYSIETTRPRRFNAGGSIENFGPNKTRVSGPSSIGYDDRLGSIPLGGYVLNQKASIANPELVALAPMTYNQGGNIVAELTPQETVFGSGIHNIPGLYGAVDAANRGQKIGGSIVPTRSSYGLFNPRLIAAAANIRRFFPGNLTSRHTKPSYEIKGTQGAYGGTITNPAIVEANRVRMNLKGRSITRSKINKLLEKEGVAPDVLLASIYAGAGSRRLSTDNLLEGLVASRVITSREAKVLSDQVFETYAKKLATLDKVTDVNNPVLQASMEALTATASITAQKKIRVLEALNKFAASPGAVADVSSRGSSGFLQYITLNDGTRINLSALEARGTGETFFHAPMPQELKRVIDSFAMGGPIAGGSINKNRRSYGIPALAPAVIARLTSRWRKPVPFAPPVQKHDWTNTDPLHGPLFIGKADIGSEGVRRSLSYRLPKNEFGKGDQLVGISPMFSNDPRYLIERYMQGDKSVMARMQYEQSRGLNTHPLSVQALFRSVAKPFRGTLYRGMTSQSVADTFPKHIVEAIERARATGDFSALIGKDFIMRRASFTANRLIASFFAPGRSSGPASSLLMEARLFGRKVTPTSQMFPDMKFEAPYGQNWSTGRSPLRRRSEEESLVGGKFIITGFDGKKLIVEGRAIGGAVSGATPYMVGEQGPELFVPESSGKIIPNRYMAGGDIIAERSAYGISGNPAKRAQQEAERQARAAAYNMTPAPQPTSQPGPLTGSRTTIVGAGGVRTNVYGVQGSLPYMPGLTLGHTPMNMLDDAIQRTTIGIKMMGDSAATAYAAAGAKMTMAQQQLVSSVTTMGESVKSAATSMASGIKSAAASTRAAASSFANMANPGYAAGFGRNLAYGTSLVMNPFGRKSGAAAGSRMANFGTGQMSGMAGMMVGSMGGMAVGQKVGGQTGAIVGSIAGPAVIMGITTLIQKIGAAGGAAKGLGLYLRIALGIIGRFIPIVGPILLIAQGLNMWRRHTEDIGKANRAVFGPSKKSLEEVGLKYTSLNDKLKTYREQLELSRAAGLASLSKDGKTGISALTLTVKELDKGIQDAKKNAKESVQLFNKTYGKQDVIKLAASLKQQYVSAGMSIQEATNKVYTLIKASNKGAYALEAISSKAFKSITDQATAADYALNLIAKTINSGDFNTEEVAVGIQNVINSLDAYRASIVGTTIGGDVISEAEALGLTMKKIFNSKAELVQLDQKTIEQLKSQNMELNYVLTKTETLAGVYAKIALLQSGSADDIDLYGTTSEQAVLIAQGAQAYNESIEKTIEKDLQLSKITKDLAKAYNSAAKAAQSLSAASYDNIIKQQEAIIKQIDKELQLRLKNLDAQEKAADFATSLKKEQLNYQKALMSGDMTAAAQAQLNIDSLQRENELMLAKQAIQDAADKKKEAAQKKIDEANKQRDLLEKRAQAAQQSAQTASTSATAFNNFNTTLARLIGTISPGEILDETDKEMLKTGLKDALDLLKQSGKQGADFVKSFMGKNMEGGGLPYLMSQSNVAYNDAASGEFKTAVQEFALAVKEFGSGRQYSAPTGSDVYERDDFGPFNSKKVALKFEHPTDARKAYGVIANEGSAGKTYLAWASAGYKFRGYDEKYAKTGLVDKALQVRTEYATIPKLAMGGAIPGYADGGSYAPGMGGYIKGPGTPTSDSILLPTGNGGLIRASDTEFMQPASSVSYYGTDFMEDLRARRIPKEIISAAMGGAIPGYKDGGSVKDGWLQKWSKSVSGSPLAEMLGTAQLLRLISGQGSKGDNLGASIVPLNLLGSGLGAKTLANLGKYAYAIPNKINQVRNQAKVNSMIKGGMWHGSQPMGFRGEEYLQGSNILEHAQTSDPYYGMGFFGTSSKSEANLYASGYNSSNNWGSSYGSMNQIVGAPRGKYIDFTRGTNSLKWQDYELAKALGVKKNKWIGEFMPENLGDIMSGQGMTGAIMNRVSSGRVPEDMMYAKWLAWNNPAGVRLLERAMGGAIPGYHAGGKVGHKHGGMPPLSMPVGSTATVDFNAKPTTASKVSDFIFGDLTGLNSFNRIVNKKASALDYVAMLPVLGAGAKTINAAGRSAIEMMGISKGIPGLGSLLPKGSIPYVSSMGSTAVNSALAGALGGSKVASSFAASKLGSDDLDISGFGGPDILGGKRLAGTENWGSLITSDSDINQILTALSAHYGVDIRPTVVREGMGPHTAGFYRDQAQSMHFPDRTRAHVVAHEATHAADFQGAYWSFKEFLDYMIKVDPAVAKNLFNEPMLNAYHVAKRGGNTTPWLYEAVQNALNRFAPQYTPYWKGLLEKNASGRIPNITPGGLDLGNSYSAIYGGRLATMLKSSLDEGYEHYRSPKFWEAIIADENMPKHLIAKGRSWIAALGRYGVTESTPADDFGLTKLIEYAKATGLAMGGSIPKFHNGGQVNTKFAGGETMALLKDKEVVFTQEQMAALGSMGSTQNSMVPTSITYAPVINAAPGMDEEMLANLVMVKLGTATNVRYRANGSTGQRVIN